MCVLYGDVIRFTGILGMDEDKNTSMMESANRVCSIVLYHSANC